LPVRFSILFIVWTAYGCFFATQAYLRLRYSGVGSAFQNTLIPWLICGYTWALLTPAVLSIARRFPVSRKKWLLSAAVHLPLSGVFSLLQLAMYLFVIRFLIIAGTGTFFDNYLFLVLEEFHAGVLVYFSIVAFAIVRAHRSRTEPTDEEPAENDPAETRRIQRTGKPEPAQNSFESRIAVKANGRIVFVDVCEIGHVTAEGNYVMLHTPEKRYLVRETMTAMERRLDPTEFVRINRSVLVRISEVSELRPLFNGDFEVVLKTGAKLAASRRRRPNLEAALGF
jgi:hypothetical protein